MLGTFFSVHNGLDIKVGSLQNKRRIPLLHLDDTHMHLHTKMQICRCKKIKKLKNS